MHKFMQMAREEVPQLENMLKKIDTFLENVPEGCLKWQNKNGKTYYYHQFMKDNKWKRNYIKKSDPSLASMLAQKQYYMAIRPILIKKSSRWFSGWLNKLLVANRMLWEGRSVV